MNARTLRRVRAGLSESDRYWLAELHAAPATRQIRVAEITHAARQALIDAGIQFDSEQHDDARRALMGALHRFFATQQGEGA